MTQTQGDPKLGNIYGVYSYLIDGQCWNHHDKARADIMGNVWGGALQGPRLLRQWIETLGPEIRRRGLKHVLDVGTGALEPEGYFHNTMSRGTKIHYSDPDPRALELSADTLKQFPNVRYIQAGIPGDLEHLINDAESFFEGEQQVAIVVGGVFYFTDDDTVAAASEAFYKWAKPKSRYYVTGWPNMDGLPGLEKIQALYKAGNVTLYGRDPDAMLPLLGKWAEKAVGNGLEPVEQALARIWDMSATEIPHKPEWAGYLGLVGAFER